VFVIAAIIVDYVVKSFVIRVPITGWKSLLALDPLGRVSNVMPSTASLVSRKLDNSTLSLYLLPMAQQWCLWPQIQRLNLHSFLTWKLFNRSTSLLTPTALMTLSSNNFPVSCFFKKYSGSVFNFLFGFMFKTGTFAQLKRDRLILWFKTIR